MGVSKCRETALPVVVRVGKPQGKWVRALGTFANRGIREVLSPNGKKMSGTRPVKWGTTKVGDASSSVKYQQ